MQQLVRRPYSPVGILSVVVQVMLLQVVQAQCSATSGDAELFTVTVDALIFAARG